MNRFGIELPSQLEENDLRYLVECLRAGVISQEEVDVIFMGHARMAISIVSEHGWRAPYLLHDLVQVAMLAIAQSINRAPMKLVDNNITAYISRGVRGAVMNAINDQHIISGTHYRREKHADPDFDPPRYMPLLEIHNEISTDPLDLVGIMDAIDKCIDADTNLKRREYKRVVVRLKAAGYKVKEIASIIEMSEAFIRGLIYDIEKKYSKIETDY